MVLKWLHKKLRLLWSKFTSKNADRLGRKIKAPMLSPIDAVRFGVFLYDQNYTRSSLIWLLLSFSGARSEDVIALRRRDVDIERDPKTGKFVKLTLRLTNFKNDRRKNIPDKIIMERRVARPVIICEAHGAAHALQSAWHKLFPLDNLVKDDDFLFMAGNYTEQLRGQEESWSLKYSSVYNMLSSDIRQAREGFKCVDSPLVSPCEISSHSNRRAFVTSSIRGGNAITSVAAFIQCETSNIPRYNVVGSDQIVDVAKQISDVLTESQAAPVRQKCKTVVVKKIGKSKAIAKNMGQSKRGRQ